MHDERLLLEFINPEFWKRLLASDIKNPERIIKKQQDKKRNVKKKKISKG